MLEIKKYPTPHKLIKYSKQKYASYETMDSDVKEELLQSLLSEQGSLCAYCMRRITESSTTIEHWYPRNPINGMDIGQGLDYRNMLAVCLGNRGCKNKDHTTCDAHKGNDTIKVNPLDPNALKCIIYNYEGIISSTNPEINKDLQDTLKLNCEAVSLPQNRRSVLNALIRRMYKKCSSRDAIARQSQRLLNKLNLECDPKTPYSGIVIWWLDLHK